MRRKRYAPPAMVALFKHDMQRRLTPRERGDRLVAIFVMRTWGIALAAIGRMAGLSPERIRQMEARACHLRWPAGPYRSSDFARASWRRWSWGLS